MNGKLWTVLVLLLALTTACASEQPNRPQLVWKDGEQSGGQNTASGAPSSATPARTGTNEKVTVEHAAVEDLLKIINREQFIVADAIQVDASLVPFQIAIVSVVDPLFVTRTIVNSAERKTQGFVLRAKNPKPYMEREFPQIRLGDGIVLMASRELSVNMHLKVTRQRPMFLVIRATGNAVYTDVESGTRLERDQITLYAEVTRRGDGTHKVSRRIF